MLDFIHHDLWRTCLKWKQYSLWSNQHAFRTIEHVWNTLGQCSETIAYVDYAGIGAWTSLRMVQNSRKSYRQPHNIFRGNKCAEVLAIHFWSLHGFLHFFVCTSKCFQKCSSDGFFLKYHHRNMLLNFTTEIFLHLVISARIYFIYY